MHLSLADIARLVGGELIGDGNVEISGCSGILEAKKGDLTFLANPKYSPQAETTQASAIIIPRQMTLPGKFFIRVDNTSLAFTQVLNRFIERLPNHHPKGIHPTAIIAPDVKIGKGVAVGAYTVIESGSSIGEYSVIYGHCYIGHGARVGSNSLIYPQVVVREGVLIGQRAIVHSGTVIGCDGYGYVTVEGRHVKIPQLGTVVIEDDVEIGANVTIDRARFDKTVIGEGTKIDNLVHIAHNVTVGKHCLIVAQVGISGSSRIGNYVILAGQVGVVGHLSIGDGAVVAAQSGVSKSIKAGEQVFGSPAQPIKEAFRTNAHVQRLSHYAATIKDLKKRIEELEKKGQ
ncbi:MAG: UDP-3-O-(3-hydroxymyristoyl)glucosamine N-acyltransferase [Candidatus Omnitrophica bacterium]|nr:UDP-3-O-(3-hydroxymyristoyl)glucosamine N-acyltransferase [Candidatus Omnitrophota bacterium]